MHKNSLGSTLDKTIWEGDSCPHVLGLLFNPQPTDDIILTCNNCEFKHGFGDRLIINKWYFFLIFKKKYTVCPCCKTKSKYKLTIEYTFN